MRLIALYLSCYAIPKADFKALTDSVRHEEDIEILESIRTLSYHEKVTKVQRIRPKISQHELNEYNRKYKQEIQEAYDILRSQAPIVTLAKDAMKKQLNPNEYPYIGEGPEQSKRSGRNAANWHKGRDETSEGRLIFFVIGGVSHFEMTSL